MKGSERGFKMVPLGRGVYRYFSVYIYIYIFVYNWYALVALI